jgi:hypothetical protein
VRGEYVVIQPATEIDEVSVCSKGAVKSATDLRHSDVRQDGHWQVGDYYLGSAGVNGCPDGKQLNAAQCTTAAGQLGYTRSFFSNGGAGFNWAPGGCYHQLVGLVAYYNIHAGIGGTADMSICGGVLKHGGEVMYIAAHHHAGRTIAQEEEEARTSGYVAAITNPLTPSNVFSWWSGVRPLAADGKKVLLVLLKPSGSDIVEITETSASIVNADSEDSEVTIYYVGVAAHPAYEYEGTLKNC